MTCPSSSVQPDAAVEDWLLAARSDLAALRARAASPVLRHREDAFAAMSEALAAAIDRVRAVHAAARATRAGAAGGTGRSSQGAG